MLTGLDVIPANALAALVRKHDLVGRFGGEEFAILLDDVDRVEAMAVADRIVSQIRDLTFSVPGLQVKISVGVSIADWTDTDGTLAELISSADKKLYEAKRTGRNRVCS
jgi:diguanylate cyclase (GGDEF)-like protein